MISGTKNPCILRLTGNGYPDMLVDELNFSWKLEGAFGKQAEYFLAVNKASGEEVWNTGWVKSAQSAGISYAGKAFESNSAYQARVWMKAEDGAEYASDPVCFSTGFMDETEWKADWLVSPYALETAGSPVFRRTLKVDRKISRARMFICGLGYYELHVNGRKISDRYMDPAWTDFNIRVNYVAHDITENLVEGENALGVCLAAGWYSNDAATPRPIFSAQLMIDYEDGSHDCILTRADNSWMVLMESWILSCSLYIGEVVDARRMIDNWSTVDFKMDQGRWTPALASEAPRGKLTPMRVEPIRIIKEMPAKTITQPKPGVYVVDFEQNMAAIVRLQLHNQQPGDEILIRYSEVLDDKGMLNTENLRTAQQRDKYIARGGEETYQCRFTYHGFRYAEITGISGELKLEDFTALVVRSDVSERSHFSTSCDLVNDIQRICVWTENNNLHSVPTDCPQRDERLGWLNDLTVRLEEAIYNFEMDVFFKKYLVDIMDTQGEKTGAIADTAPFNRYGARPADAVCSSYLLLPWLIHQHYNDEALLKKAWPGIKAWTDYLANQRVDGIVSYSYYGDWAAPIGGNVRGSVGSGAVSAITPGSLMSTGFLYMNCTILVEVAKILGMPEQEAYYTALAAESAEALNRVYLNKEKGYYGTNSQAANTFMLYLNIVPEEYQKKVLENLEADILARDIHTTTGNLCSRYILDVLADYGKIDLAYAIVNQTTYPSWGYMLSRGATTTWERWEYVDSGELVGMASHDHPMYSTVSGWFYKYLAGFRPLEAGFASFELRPFFPEKLDHAEASVKTVKGEAAISWTKKDGRVTADILVPFNSSCVFTFTADSVENIMLNGEAIPGAGKVMLPSGRHTLAFCI